MPLLVMDLFRNMPGLPGLFLSAVVSASIRYSVNGVSLALIGGGGHKEYLGMRGVLARLCLIGSRQADLC